MSIRIEEGFFTRGKHTKEYKMKLVDRSAPTPDEKEIIESVPFMQGHYDFSAILGGRVYENRPLTYTFKVIDRKLQNKKIFETAIKNWLMRGGHETLYDSHYPGYYFLAKCVSVDAEFNVKGLLEVTTVFDAYPFMIAELHEGNDIWDTFNFELDVAQITEFDVNGSIDIMLYNVGASNLTPTIKASAPMTIIKDGVSFEINAGETKSHEFVLSQGENRMTIKGNGMIEFLFYKELI